MKRLMKQSQEIVNETIRLYRDSYYHGVKSPEGKMKDLGLFSRDCMRLSHAACEVMRLHGFDATVQAGTAKWMCSDEQEFAYECDHWVAEHGSLIDQAGIATVFILTLGVLPEMHAWALCESEQVIVDIPAMFIPEVAADLGLSWNRPRPSPVVNADKLPPGTIYQANDIATRLAEYISHQEAFKNSHKSSAQR